jgi:hypothetical protein
MDLTEGQGWCRQERDGDELGAILLDRCGSTPLDIRASIEVTMMGGRRLGIYFGLRCWRSD